MKTNIIDYYLRMPNIISHIYSTAPKLPFGLARLISQSIFQDVHCQSQLQHDRRTIYKTLKNLLAFHLKGMIYKYIHLNAL